MTKDLMGEFARRALPYVKEGNAFMSNIVMKHYDIRSGETMTAVDSTSDERTVNNVMRHKYRVLSDEEKKHMAAFKDMGLEFVEYCDSLEGSRELSIAKTKIEEAVMWAVKHVTR